KGRILSVGINRVNEQGILEVAIASGQLIPDDNEGFVWGVQVTLSGPTANNVSDRGVTRIEVGVIQNVKIITHRANYLVDGVERTLVAQNDGRSLEGQSFLDALPGDVYYLFQQFKPSELISPIEGQHGILRNRDLLTSADSPTQGAPLHYLQGDQLAGSGDGIIKQLSIKDLFTLWLSARTVDAANGANAIYTARAVANWIFNISQENPTLLKRGDPSPLSSVILPIEWTPIRDGRKVPITSGITANEMGQQVTFK
ncbi:MAG: hypothetical protein ACRD4L_00455, partial [Pyrinomonadaceae bacterium]